MDHQRRFVLSVERLQHGTGGADRFGIGHGMSAVKVAKAADVKLGFDGTGDDAFEALSHLLMQSGKHGVGAFADRDYEHAAVGIQVVQVLANAENSTLGVHLPGEGLADARFPESVCEDVASDFLHVISEVPLVDGMTGKGTIDKRKASNQAAHVEIVSLIQASTASRISRNLPSKK